MTRTGRWYLALAIALVGATARAGDEKVNVPELLPAPHSCCQDSCCSKSDCCKSASCPACEAKHEKSGLETRVFNVGPLLTWDQTSGESAHALIKIISEHIQPGTWSMAGGPGNIEYYPLGRALVVNQTADVHAKIAKLLPLLQKLQECASVPLPPPAPADMPAGMFFVAVPHAPPTFSAFPSPEAHAVAAPQPSFCPFQLLNTKEESCPFTAPCPMANAAFAASQPSPAPNCFGIFFGHSGEAPSGIAPAAMIQAVPPPAPVMLSKMMNVPQAANSSCWRLQALTAEGKTRLAVHCDCNMCMTCENVEIAVAGTNKLKIAAGDGKICIQSADLQATPDTISCQGQTGCIVLEGHVHLRYEKNGQHAIVTAQHVMLNLKTGQLDMQAASGGSIQFDALRVQGGIQ